MIFIDLNAEMPSDVSETNRPAFIAAVNKRLDKYERDELPAGEKAYLFVTNLSFHKNLNQSAQLIAWPVGLGIPDFNRPGYYRLSDWHLQEQKHSDALRVAHGLSRILTWPTTFDGSLPSVGLKGERPPVQIGETYNFEGAGPNGEELVGVVTSAIMLEADKTVMVAVSCVDGKSYLLKEQVSDTQLADYQAHPDAYFGEIIRPPTDCKTPQALFNFFIDAFAELPREELLLRLHGRVKGVEMMPDDQLLAVYCEGLVSASGAFELVDGVMTPQPAKRQQK